MRKYKTKKVDTQVLQSVTCNGCGAESDESCDQGPSYHAHVDYSGGYNSNPLWDMTDYEFDLCEGCLRRIMRELRVPPTVYGRLEGKDIADPKEMWRE